MFIEHFRSPTPGTLTICYAAIKAIFTATALRTYTLIGLRLAFPSFFVVCAVLAASYMLIAVVELVEKRRLMVHKVSPTPQRNQRNKYTTNYTQDMPPFTTANFVSRSSYLWLFPLLRRGTKRLDIEDLSSIPTKLGANATRVKIQARLRSTPLVSSSIVYAD